MKKKIIFSIVLFIFFFVLAVVLFFSYSYADKRDYSSYSPEKAVEYSYKYALERNPEYPYFASNCVCYISQCLVAGGLEMDDYNIDSLDANDVLVSLNKWFCYFSDDDPYKPISYYSSSPFSALRFFKVYWTRIAGVPFYSFENTKENREFLLTQVHPGDVLVLYGDGKEHVSLIVKVDDNDIYYNSNTKDRLDYPLSLVDDTEYTEVCYFKFVNE